MHQFQFQYVRENDVFTHFRIDFDKLDWFKAVSLNQGLKMQVALFRSLFEIFELVPVMGQTVFGHRQSPPDYFGDPNFRFESIPVEIMGGNFYDGTGFVLLDPIIEDDDLIGAVNLGAILGLGPKDFLLTREFCASLYDKGTDEVLDALSGWARLTHIVASGHDCEDMDFYVRNEFADRVAGWRLAVEVPGEG